jgi:hypothetical protein
MALHSIDSIIVAFVEASKSHYDATMAGDHEAANKQAKELHNLFQKITSLGTDARKALLAKTEDDDMAVVAMTAVYSLKYDTERSLAALKRIADDPSLIGFEAQQAIKRWEEGSWQLE